MRFLKGNDDHARRPRRGGRWALALAVVVLVLGDATVAFADTFPVRAVRTSNGWRWRDGSGDNHTFIDRGDYIRWRNPTTVTHNVRSYGVNWSYSRTLDPGESVRRQFNSTGNFRYRCTRHSSLTEENGRLVCRGQCGIIHV
jgi:hypothetical protein